MAIDLPSDIAVDLRNPVLGDSFGWAGVEPAAAKKSIVIHATASEDPNEDGFTVANYHVQVNGWGGCGVHLVETKDAYAGRPGETNPGAQLQYVGDLLTWRAGCLDQNPGRIHIEISGLYTPGHGVPSEKQLRDVRKFIDYMLAPNNIMPSLNFYSQVTYHNAVPEQNTACPGWEHPQFHEWFNYLQGGAEPSWFGSQQPAPTPPPIPVVEPIVEPVVTPAAPAEVSEWQASWQEDHRKGQTRLETHAYDMATGQSVADIPAGHEFDIAGTMRKEGQLYVRSEFSLAHSTWIGVPAVDLKDIPIPTTVVSNPGPVETQQQFLNAVSQADASTKLSAWERIKELVAIVISPLLKLIGRKTRNVKST